MRKKRVCKDEMGREIDALTIFTTCIQYMTNSLMKNINEIFRSIEFKLEEIEIILTLPDICEGTSEMLLAKAAQKVNIVRFENVINLASHFHILFILLIYLV